MKPTPLSIFRAVAADFAMREGEMLDMGKRGERVTRAREVASYTCKFLGFTWDQIKRSLHSRNHSTFSSAHQRYIERSAACERRFWVDRVLAAHGIPNMDGLGGAMAERARMELAA